MSRLGLLSLLPLIFAGCVSPLGTDAASAAPLASADPPPETGSFRWWTDASFPRLAIGFRVSASEGSVCEYRFAVASDGPAGIRSAALAVEGGEVVLLGAGGGGMMPADVHAGSVSVEDTAAALTGTGRSATLVNGEIEIGPAPVEFALAGRDVMPWDVQVTENGSVLVELSCDGAIVVDGFAASDEVAFFAAGNAPEGVGGHVAFVVAAGAAEATRLDADSPRVLGAARARNAAGSIWVESPEARGEGIATPSGGLDIGLDGGAGPWALGATAATGAFLPAVGAIVGLTPVASFDAYASAASNAAAGS